MGDPGFLKIDFKVKSKESNKAMSSSRCGKRRNFKTLNFHLLSTSLAQKKVENYKEEIYFFRSENLYPAPEISNANLNFKIGWAQIISAGN